MASKLDNPTEIETVHIENLSGTRCIILGANDSSSKSSSRWSLHRNLRQLVKCCHYEWRVNIDDLIKGSPAFPVDAKPEDQYRLHIIHIHDRSMRHPNYMNFELQAVKQRYLFAIEAKIVFPELNSATFKLFKMGTPNGFDFLRFLGPGPDGFTVHSGLNFKVAFLERDTLLVHCFLKVFHPPKPTEKQATLDAMFKERLFTDMVIRTEERNFDCHKIMLASASPVFRAMLEHNMKERRENTIDWRRVWSAQQVQEMLDFIYSEEVPNDEDRMMALQTLAEMYLLKKHGSIRTMWEIKMNRIKMENQHLEVRDCIIAD